MRDNVASRFSFKTWSLIVLGGLSTCALVYVLLISYLVSGGFKNYENFCSAYLPLLSGFYKKNLDYPESLSYFDKPGYYPNYEAVQCSYSKTESGFMFSVPVGLIGVAIYNSSQQKWFYD